jgi:hypothetical protein
VREWFALFSPQSGKKYSCEVVCFVEFLPFLLLDVKNTGKGWNQIQLSLNFHYLPVCRPQCAHWSVFIYLMNFAFFHSVAQKNGEQHQPHTQNKTVALCLLYGWAQFFPFISFSFCINFLSRLTKTTLRKTGEKLFQPEKAADLSRQSSFCNKRVQRHSPTAPHRSLYNNVCLSLRLCLALALWLQPRVCCQFFSPLPSSAFAHSGRFLRL